MIQPFKITLYILSGVSLTMMFIFLGSYLKLKKENRAFTFYTFSIITLPLYTFLTSLIYQSTTPEQIMDILRIQMFCTPVIMVFYLFFIAKYTNQLQKKVLILFSLLFFPIPFIRMFSPTLLLYKGTLGVNLTTLPWGETIHTLSADITNFGYYYFLLNLIIVLYILVLCILYFYKRGTKAGAILLIQALLVVGIINDILVDAMSLSWVYLGEITLTGTIVFMGWHMITDMLQGVLLKKRLEQKEKQLSQIIKSGGASLFSIDSKGYYSLINDEFCIISNMPEEKILGSSCFSNQNNPYLQSLSLKVKDVLKDKIRINFETTTIINGKTVHLHTTIVPTGSEDIGIVGITTDISELSRMKNEILHIEKMSAVGQLAGGIAHDFNNMLAGIMGAAQLLQLSKNDLSEKNLKYVNMIMGASARASELTEKLLSFSRKGQRGSTAVNIHTIIDDTILILENTIDKKISINVKKEAENYTFIGDNSDFQNTLLNLGINASHAMPNGGDLQIITRNIFLDQAYCKTSPFEIEVGEYIELEIRDSGSGISKENLKKIFDPFFTTKKVGKGTGMGLAAVYGTVLDHHGAISVYSETGTGTVFHIYIPCSTSSITEKKQINIIQHSASGLILLVDDEEIIRTTGKLLLEEMGYTIILATNGFEAIELFKKQYSKIDLVIMDMIMPEMNGSEAFFQMKKIDPECKILLSSGFTKDEDLKLMEKEGLSGFLHKPYRTSELSRVLSEILN